MFYAWWNPKRFFFPDFLAAISEPPCYPLFYKSYVVSFQSNLYTISRECKNINRLQDMNTKVMILPNGNLSFICQFLSNAEHGEPGASVGNCRGVFCTINPDPIAYSALSPERVNSS